MNDDEQDEQPGKDVVNVANHGQAAHQILYRFQHEVCHRCQTGMVSGPHQDQPRDEYDDDHEPATAIGQSLHGPV